MSEELEEGKIVTYAELRELYGSDNDSELKKLTLRCLNCGHIDTVMGMRKKKTQSTRKSPSGRWAERLKECVKESRKCANKGDSGENKDIYTFGISSPPFNSTYKPPSPFGGKPLYEEALYCPNCGSTAVTLTKESVKKATAKAL